MTTAVNIGRINVWPTYDAARDAALEADTVACEAVGQLTVWRTNAQARDHLTSEGGGSGAPEWVPDNARIYIDLVNVRAWTEADGEVEIDTLLGSDPNTSSGWGDSSYDSSKLTEHGYPGGPPEMFAFIGEARTQLLAGSTIQIRTTGIDLNSSPPNDNFGLLSADGDNALEIDMANGDLFGSSWGGTWNVSIDNCVNYSPTGTFYNVFAATITPTRAELAMSGSTVSASILTEDDFPTTVSPLVAVFYNSVSSPSYVQSITIYDALPDTTGLSELSETA